MVSICAVAVAVAAPASAPAAPLLARHQDAADAALTQPIRHVEPVQRRSFGIFRTAPERLPTSIANCLDTFQGHGFNPALAQRAKPPGAQRALWAIPGHGQILLARVLAEGCAIVTATNVGAAVRGLGFRLVAGGDPAGSAKPDVRAAGIVPDGVSAVELARHLVARVRNNAYSIDARGKHLYRLPILIRTR
jgi:hypothetical protein